MSKYFAHESSFLDDNVKIGDDTKIWHFTHVLSGLLIGKSCSFGQNCVVGPNVSIGSGVKVQNNVSIYEGLEIQDSVFLGPSMVFTNIVNPRSFIVRKEELKKTLLKKGCSIGANATVICGNTIGRYALVGAGSVVSKDVKDFALVVGVPAKQIGWVSVAGNRLDFSDDNIAIDTFDNSKYVLKSDEVKLMEE